MPGSVKTKQVSEPAEAAPHYHGHRERLRRLERTYGDWYAEELGIPVEEARDAARVLLAGLGGAIDRWNRTPSRTTRNRLERTYVTLMLGGLRALTAGR